MRISRDGGRSYPKRWRRRVTSAHPHQPATISVYNPEAGTGRLLALDFDLGKARQSPRVADAAAQVRADAADCGALIARCGGRVIADVAPLGGRHLYVLWETALPWQDLYLLALALQRRYPLTLDPTPHASPHGQIRPPGSRYKSIAARSPGFQQLTTPLDEALAALAHPNDASVWARLHEELAGELQQTASVQLVPDNLPRGDALLADEDGPRDADGDLWLPRDGGPAPLRPDLADIAFTGQYDPARYDAGTGTAGHAARQAVITSLAARGWRLSEVRRRIHDGTWPGLTRLYARYGLRHRDAALARDWKKAITYIQRKESLRNSDTWGSDSPGALASGGSRVVSSLPWPLEVSSAEKRTLLCRSKKARDLPHLTPYQQARCWWNAVLLAERDPDRRQSWGRASISIRLVLRALGAAAQMSGMMTVEFGVRSLSLMTGLHYDTVAQILTILREEPDPFIERLEAERGERADLYLLQIPDAYRQMALWQRWRAGTIQALHPAFRLLGGGTTALVYEHLTSAPTSRNDLIRLAALAPSTVSEALAVLLQYGLAERTPEGWIRGPEDLDILADYLGATLQVQALRDLYREHRKEWRALLASWRLTVDDIVRQDPGDGPIPAEPSWSERTAPQHPADARPAPAPPDDDLQRVADAEVPVWLDDHLGADTLPPRIPARDPVWEEIWGTEVEAGRNPLRSVRPPRRPRARADGPSP
ncbi:hypothetical protein [Planomonospora parontospora]|uniref:hypothetical protein n=1 Tax=Planomonospora parontospora TaxID=58119 RepID=UPI00166FCCE0|nr:hypothetical protein [Planomonospora parontospora]GGL49934.1 hypothetical protein GCM10014719_58970 [Planomonospora parontospora subsp. antibiotica]GII19333.1 hypothetical protein Ppa05_60590 [Planomonospora parontospora subsp. antibiotica]